MEETLRKNKLSFRNTEDQKESYLSTTTGFSVFLLLPRWALHLLCVCPFPFPQQWEGVSLPTNMTGDEVHEGVQAYLA